MVEVSVSPQAGFACPVVLPARLHFAGGLPPLAQGPCDFRVWAEVTAPPFLRMECVTQDLAYVLVDPRQVIPGYAPRFSDGDRQAVGLGLAETPVVLAIVNFNRDPQRPSVNLVGPLLIHPVTGAARQVVLENVAEYSSRHVLCR